MKRRREEEGEKEEEEEGEEGEEDQYLRAEVDILGQRAVGEGVLEVV